MSVIDMAWEEDQEERPNFVELCEIFESWVSKDVLSGREKAWLDHPRGHAVYNKKKKAEAAADEDGQKASRRLSGSGFFSRGNSFRRGSRGADKEGGGHDDRRVSNFF